jgi:septum formation protein
MTPARPTLILASTSRYRRELLERLRLPFSCRPMSTSKLWPAGAAVRAPAGAGQSGNVARNIPMRW